MGDRGLGHAVCAVEEVAALSRLYGGDAVISVAAPAGSGGDAVASVAATVALRRPRCDLLSVVSAAHSPACSVLGLLSDEGAKDEERQQQRRTSGVQPQR